MQGSAISTQLPSQEELLVLASRNEACEDEGGLLHNSIVGMGMRVQEGDRSGEQGNKVSQLKDAVSDLLQVLLPEALQEYMIRWITPH